MYMSGAMNDSMNGPPPGGRLKEAAREKGANAVLAMRFDCNEIADIMSEVAAYGTAVTVRRI